MLQLSLPWSTEKTFSLLTSISVFLCKKLVIWYNLHTQKKTKVPNIALQIDTQYHKIINIHSYCSIHLLLWHQYMLYLWSPIQLLCSLFLSNNIFDLRGQQIINKKLMICMQKAQFLQSSWMQSRVCSWYNVTCIRKSALWCCTWSFHW